MPYAKTFAMFSFVFIIILVGRKAYLAKNMHSYYTKFYSSKNMIYSRMYRTCSERAHQPTNPMLCGSRMYWYYKILHDRIHLWSSCWIAEISSVSGKGLRKVDIFFVIKSNPYLESNIFSSNQIDCFNHFE